MDGVVHSLLETTYYSEGRCTRAGGASGPPCDLPDMDSCVDQGSSLQLMISSLPRRSVFFQDTEL